MDLFVVCYRVSSEFRVESFEFVFFVIFLRILNYDNRRI